jgi:preprotein translocase SecF subunit
VRTIDLVGARKRFFLGSGILLLISIVLLAVAHLRPGIEFTSGTTMLVEFDQTVSQEELRTVYADLGHADARIQSTGGDQYLIRTRELQVPPGSFTDVAPAGGSNVDVIGPEPLAPVGTLLLGASDAEAGSEVLLRSPFGGDACNPGAVAGRYPAGTEATVVEVVSSCSDGVVYRVVIDESIGYVAEASTHEFQAVVVPPSTPVTQDAGERTVIEQRLFDEFGTFNVLEFASVSAVVSSAAVRNAGAAVVVASLFIMAYVAFAFASLPRPFRYAACAIAALIHDVVIVLGAFALFGVLFGTEINLMFVTGLLTVIGFSVHDTIVVFDRVRENIRSAPNATLHENINAALLQRHDPRVPAGHPRRRHGRDLLQHRHRGAVACRMGGGRPRSPLPPRAPCACRDRRLARTRGRTRRRHYDRSVTALRCRAVAVKPRVSGACVVFALPRRHQT